MVQKIEVFWDVTLSHSLSSLQRFGRHCFPSKLGGLLMERDSVTFDLCYLRLLLIIRFDVATQVHVATHCPVFVLLLLFM